LIGGRLDFSFARSTCPIHDLLEIVEVLAPIMTIRGYAGTLLVRVLGTLALSSVIRIFILTGAWFDFLISDGFFLSGRLLDFESRWEFTLFDKSLLE
jgi:hypothetical protein